MASRQLDVQTPGATPEAEQPQKPAATPGRPLGSADHRARRAHEIDPATLNKPVLSADGWVMPPPSTVKPEGVRA